MTKKIIHYTVCFMIIIALTSTWFAFVPKQTEAVQQREVEIIEFSVCGIWVEGEILK